MTIDEIKELIQVFNESGVAEMEVQRGENRLRLRRASINQEIVMPMPQMAAMPAAPVAVASAAPAIPAAAPAQTATAMPKAPEPDSGHVLVKSPIVGTYYDAPAPGAAPFVKVGDAVEAGTVLCIIESMKLMNEIESEVAGVVASKLCENGRAVEYGEALFAIRPR
jgi:acetyl-CoA carboxylase biotin carboxyl carrier protein